LKTPATVDRISWTSLLPFRPDISAYSARSFSQTRPLDRSADRSPAEGSTPAHPQAPHPIAPCLPRDAHRAPRRFAIASAQEVLPLRETVTAPCPWGCETASSRAPREIAARFSLIPPACATSCDSPVDPPQLVHHLVQRAIDQLRDLICLQ